MAVTIQLTLDSITGKEAKALIAMLHTLDGVEVKNSGPTLVITPLTASDFGHHRGATLKNEKPPCPLEHSFPGRHEEVAPESVDPTPPTSAPVAEPTEAPSTATAPTDPTPSHGSAAPTAEKPKRTRKHKEAAVEPTDPIFAPTAEVLPSPTVPVNSDAPTLDMLRDAVQHLIGKKGLPAAKELLKEFACARVIEMAENAVEQQVEFIRRCNV